MKDNVCLMTMNAHACLHMLNNHDYSFRFLLPQVGTPRSRHEVTTQFATCARKHHDITLVVNQQRAYAPKQMSSPRFSLPRARTPRGRKHSETTHGTNT